MNGSVTILLYLLCLVAEMNGNDAFDDAFEDERESESFLSQRTVTLGFEKIPLTRGSSLHLQSRYAEMPDRRSCGHYFRCVCRE
jgi:hypothetical protein